MHRLPLRCSLRTLLTVLLAACCFLGGRSSRDHEVAEWQGKLRDFEEDAKRLHAVQYDSLEIIVCGSRRSVSGIVMATSDRELAEINVGMDDGVCEGVRFDLKRGEKHVGTGIVRKVTADRAVIENDGRRGWMVRKGDHALSSDDLAPSQE